MKGAFGGVVPSLLTLWRKGGVAIRASTRACYIPFLSMNIFTGFIDGSLEIMDIFHRSWSVSQCDQSWEEGKDGECCPG